MEPMTAIQPDAIVTPFVFTRVLDAPRRLVYQAWTEPQRLEQWWGPKGLGLSVEKLELRPGGVFHYCMHLPDGLKMWGRFVYREITAPERIVYVNSFSDKAANIIRAPFSTTWPLEVLNTLTLTEQEGKTTLTLQGMPINATAEEMNTFENMFASMQQGFGGTLDQLEAYLAKTKAEFEKPAYKKPTTMATINPYLNFNGNTEEAFNFYKSVFGGEFAMLQRFKETPEAGKVPEHEQDKIMHIALPIGNGTVLMATDALESMGQTLTIGNNFSLSVNTESEAAADKTFNGLSAGGKVIMPLQKTFWGAYFGMLADKFGIQWMVSYDANYAG